MSQEVYLKVFWALVAKSAPRRSREYHFELFRAQVEKFMEGDGLDMPTDTRHGPSQVRHDIGYMTDDKRCR